MIHIGFVDDVSMYLSGVSAAEGLLTVTLSALGPSVDAQSKAWHEAVEASVLRWRASSVSERPTPPEAPGNGLLLPIRPEVTVGGEQLSLRRDVTVSIAGFDPPWESRWRFRVSDQLPNDSPIVVCVAALERGPDNPAFVGCLRDLLAT